MDEAARHELRTHQDAAVPVAIDAIADSQIGTAEAERAVLELRQASQIDVVGAGSNQMGSMTVESFQATYGKTFSSHCGLYDSYVGYEIFFY